jgi:hypothetical protein
MPAKHSARSVRIDDDSYRILVEVARAEDRPITWVLREVVAAFNPGFLERAGASPKPPSAPPGPTAAAMQAKCSHPGERLRVMKWGVVCERCGAVVP